MECKVVFARGIVYLKGGINRNIMECKECNISIYSAEKEGEEIPKASFVAVDVEEYAKMHFNKNLKEKEGGR